MGVLVIKCPVSGREFSTGIQTDVDSLARMRNEVSSARCPYCLTQHSWRPLDARLVAIADLVQRIGHQPIDHRYTMMRIAVRDASPLRIGNPSHFLGLDMVSVHYVGPPPPPPGWSRHK